MSNNNDDTRRSIVDTTAFLSATNELQYIIEQTVRNILETSCLVRIDKTQGGGVAPTGTVSATPLVAQTDAWHNILPMTTIPRMPFFRYQAGRAAVIVDPVQGDQGVAVFAKNDSSNVQVGTQEPVRPGSYRHFDQADGMYFGGVQNQTPSVWIELRQDETIIIHAPAGVVVETEKTAAITAGESVTITAPQIKLNGALTMQSDSGGTTTATLAGTMHATQDVTASGISLNSHVHGGVQSGGDNTGQPQ